MAVEDTDGYWDIVVSSLQDICNANESLSFDEIFEDYDEKKLRNLNEADLEALKEEINDHILNIGTAKRLISTSQQNLQTLIAKAEKAQQQQQQATVALRSSKNQSSGKNLKGKKGNSKYGRLYWVSKYDPLEPIMVRSEVAYKLKNRHFEEWIQCEVTKILGDGTKYEIRDPEPDENNNPGQTFKANYKEILLVPSKLEVPNLISYPYGTKVLARYPETTTFYPAVVVGQKKDGTVRLKFDGEEEVNKETEVERRLVLPFPER
ncbi:CIC11C00000001878 [Sungouiella intermedia]|uniref:CIC11C00000001878 n=1 Tax=Sungouiella intermedia TaxID=45354 RepID=A0A1L0DJM1_9ASCO|nr:CIC11C00000001878 [[Candida] intermedia]